MKNSIQLLHSNRLLVQIQKKKRKVYSKIYSESSSSFQTMGLKKKEATLLNRVRLFINFRN